jgi:hypothetical protein
MRPELPSQPYIPQLGYLAKRDSWWSRYAPAPSPTPEIAGLKRLIWLYWLLWLFEGALRKWIDPQLAAPLLLVRDPVAFLIIVRALQIGVWQVNGWTAILGFLGTTSFAFTVAQGIPISVAVIGLRTVVLHLPLIFIIGRVLTRDDVERIGNLVLDLGFPMALLMAAQFLAGEGSFLNAGAGLDVVQIGGVGEGRIRAPGIFSFITGAAQFFSLVTAFWLARFGQEQRIGWALGLAGASILIAINVALSRTLVAACAVVFAAFMVVLITGRVSLGRIVLLVLSAAMLVGLFLGSDVLREGNELLVIRFESAADMEGSFFARAFGGFVIPGDVLTSAGVTGHGLGVGTNMGAALLGSPGDFLLAESEWPRVVLEMGAVLGLAFIFWRICLFVKMASDALSALRHDNSLPLLLLAAGGLNLVNGQSGQPATLGFIALAGGLVIAASKQDEPERRPVNPGPSLVRQRIGRRFQA